MADRLRSAFCVLANPEEIITYKHNENGTIVTDEDGKKVILKREPNSETEGMTESEICNHYLNMWVTSGKKRTGAVLFCESADGFRHLHCVFESENAFTFTALKKVFPKMHIEPTQGSKEDVEDYINKSGKFEEKGEKVLAKEQVGEIIGKQGARTDLIKLDEVKRLIFEEGKSPRDIFLQYPQALKSEHAVKWLYHEKRRSETPLERDIHVTWLCGKTGCGKSHTFVDLCNKYGVDNVYRVTDYCNPFDSYNGQDIIFFEEFRGQFRLADLLQYLDKYPMELRARYSNSLALWTKVYISSPVTPYELYNKDGDTKGTNDKLQQLYRRVSEIRYCFKVSDDEHTYYIQKVFPCDLDNSPENIYKSFFAVNCRVSQQLMLYGQKPKTSQGFFVSAVSRSKEDIEQEERLIDEYGVSF